MFKVTMAQVSGETEEISTLTYKCGECIATITLDCSPLPLRGKRYLILLETGEFAFIPPGDYSEIPYLIVDKFSENHIIYSHIHTETSGSVLSSLEILWKLCRFNSPFPGVIISGPITIFCDEVIITGKLLQVNSDRKVVARINIASISSVEVSPTKFRITI